MDIVESINRYLAGSPTNKGERTRLTRARDEIVRLRTSQQPAQQQEPVLTSNCPKCKLMVKSTNTKGIVWRCPICQIEWPVKRTAQPRREWVGLTEDEFDDLYFKHHDEHGLPINDDQDGFAYERSIEAKLKEKNT